MGVYRIKSTRSTTHVLYPTGGPPSYPAGGNPALVACRSKQSKKGKGTKGAKSEKRI